MTYKNWSERCTDNTVLEGPNNAALPTTQVRRSFMQSLIITIPIFLSCHTNFSYGSNKLFLVT